MTTRITVLLVLALAAWGCDDEAANTGDTGAGGGGGTGGGAGTDNGLPPLLDMAPLPGDAGGGDTDVPDEAIGDPCDPNPCGRGETCAVVGGIAECSPAACEDLDCGEFEECVIVDGGGAECVDTRCDDDLDCPEAQFCEGTCVDDRCVPGDRVCAGQAIEQCADNGSGRFGEFTCESPTEGYESACAEEIAGAAACTCRDEWDCPEYQACEGGRCRGTGEEPTCRLDPVPFTESLPAPEIVWGGVSADPLAIGRPFARSAQAVMTPVVANLDDDNGDGLIDARDFPEIIFMTFCNSVFSADGTVRAIHGGGPDKGRDYFAAHGPYLWREGDALPAEDSYECGEGIVDPTASLAVADLDDPATSDGRPEIIAVHTNGNSGLVVYDNTGEKLLEAFVGEMNRAGGNPAVAVANVDGQGMAEVILGGHVVTFARADDGSLEAVDLFSGNLGRGTNGQGAVPCVADLLGDGRPEIIAGSTVYALPDPPPGATRRADCADNGGDVDPGGGEAAMWCAGELVVRWDARTVDPDDARINREGFCAIADVLGAGEDPPGPQNPPDGTPEVILISDGTLQIFDGPTGALRHHRVLQELNTPRGGAPNVDDFDGDGFPEIGSAFRTGYVMMDLQPPTESCPAWPVEVPDGAEQPPENAPRMPGGDCDADRDCNPDAVCGPGGRCVCLHNGWRRITEDDSSRVTGSTLFDFNGDDAAEVIYNDECWFRIYDGQTGDVLFKEPSESRTRIEHPIVADVDNDGNAEIVFTVSNESGFCSQRGDPLPPPNQDRTYGDVYNNGLEVWGDPQDRWVSARRIWSQHAYHVPAITESGAVPVLEPQSWLDYNGRSYNTYRSQPRSFGVAPDLTVRAVQFQSEDAPCGTLSNVLTLSADIANIGDLRVGPGVAVAFEGTWDGMTRPLTGPDGDPIVIELVESLEPSATTRVAATYDVTRNGDDPDRLPDRVDAIVDALGDPDFGRERECREDNNRAGADIVAPDPLPDLRLELVTAIGRICPRADLSVTISNQSEVPAEGVIVRFFAGNPALGMGLGEIDFGTLEPGETAMRDLTIETLPRDRAVVIYAMVDPDERIAECSDGDNVARAEGAIQCIVP